MTLNRDCIIQIALNMFTKLAEIISATCTRIMLAAHGMQPDHTDLSHTLGGLLDPTPYSMHTHTPLCNQCDGRVREREREREMAEIEVCHAEIGNDSSRLARSSDRYTQKCPRCYKRRKT